MFSQVSGKQLEKVREVKRIMSRLMHKVSKLKKALEKLLDDDLDMMVCCSDENRFFLVNNFCFYVWPLLVLHFYSHLNLEMPYLSVHFGLSENQYDRHVHYIV